MHFLKCFNILASIFFFYPLQEEKLCKLREVVPTSTPEAEPEESTSISTPTEEEVAEESQVQGVIMKTTLFAIC